MSSEIGRFKASMRNKLVLERKTEQENEAAHQQALKRLRREPEKTQEPNKKPKLSQPSSPVQLKPKSAQSGATAPFRNVTNGDSEKSSLTSKVVPKAQKGDTFQPVKQAKVQPISSNFGLHVSLKLDCSARFNVAF